MDIAHYIFKLQYSVKTCTGSVLHLENEELIFKGQKAAIWEFTQQENQFYVSVQMAC